MKKRIGSVHLKSIVYSAATLAFTLLAAGAKWRPG